MCSKIYWDGVVWTPLTKDGDNEVGCCEHGNELFDFLISSLAVAF
jgi:hypothetical protein